MQLTHLEAAVILGVVIPHISSIGISSAPPDCVAALKVCMSDLCVWERAFYNSICRNEGCQIKGSEVCNMTIQTVLDRFPSLRGCVCAWEDKLCDSIQALATQCHRKPASQQRRSTLMDWKSSSLTGYAYDAAGSCFEQMQICISDAVCNRYLTPVLQACTADLCDPEHCQRVTRHFYGSMPHNVAEMLGMCDCEGSDQSCLEMKSVLHSGACGDETRICQDTVTQCVRDSHCRDLLKTFQAKCWSSDEDLCSDSDLQSDDECFINMDPTLILGTRSECKVAFLATLGTSLHHACSCEGVNNDDRKTCNMIHDVLHNRSYFMTSLKSTGPSKPPEFNESEPGHTWLYEDPLYAFATVLLVGIFILIILAAVSAIWMWRKRDKKKLHHPKKSNCGQIL